MFSFSKKKEKTDSQNTNKSDPGDAGGPAAHSLPTIGKPLKSWKSSNKDGSKHSTDPPLSKDEIQRLEDTKYKLFGPTISTNKTKPIPPPRPPKLKTDGLAMANNSGTSPNNPNAYIHNRTNSVTSDSSTLDSPTSAGGGLDFGFHPLKTFNMQNIDLPVLAPTNLAERTVTISRLPNGEFGFSLRRAQVVKRNADHTEERQTVIHAEPIQAQRLPTINSAKGLMPGDQLVAVNGENVEQKSREQVIQMIRDSGNTVNMTVRPVAELSELTLRSMQQNEDSASLDPSAGELQIKEPNTLHRSRSKRWKNNIGSNNNSNENGGAGGGLKNAVWLAHKGGYAPAADCGPAEGDAQVRIQLHGASDHMIVDQDDIEKANPPEMDKAEDLGHLLYLNESSALHLLRTRYGSNLVHTYAGSTSTVILNPQYPLSVYSEKVVAMFKGCKREDMPPHIYAVAQQVFRTMQATRRNQAVVMSGASGTGKTKQTQHLLHYLCSTAGTVGQILTGEKLNGIFGLLEAFGNCRMGKNPNASRFATLFTLDFDHVSQISSGIVQGLLLETKRVVESGAKGHQESNFHVFYYMWEGCEGELRKELGLDSIHDPSAIFTSLHKPGDKETARTGWNKLIASMERIGMNEEERHVIFSVLAAIVHLGYAGAKEGLSGMKSEFVRTQAASKAGELLGIDFHDLHKAIFTSQNLQEDKKLKEKPSSSGKRLDKHKISFRASLEKMSLTDRVGNGQDALNAFIVGLYKELFSVIISLVNRSLQSNYRTLTSLTVVDCPGWQSSGSLLHPDKRRAGSFADLCFNYVNERLSQLFYQCTFTNELELYKQENISVDFIEPTHGPQAIVDLLDKPSQQELIKSTNIERRSQEKRGLFWLLDQESIFPGASEESLMERLFVHLGDKRDGILRKSRHHNEIVVGHCLGTNPVTYDIQGWLKHTQESPVTRSVLSLLQDSSKETVSTLFLSVRSGGLVGMVGGGDSTSSVSARRTTTVFKTFNNPEAIKRKSYPIMVKFQMDCIVEMVRRMNRQHFVHCIQPTGSSGRSSADQIMHVPLVRTQIRGLQLLESVRLNKIGFPERMSFGEFRRRFECIVAGEFENKDALLDDRAATGHLMEALQVDASQFKLGLSLVFMRNDLLCQLEDRRDVIVGSVIRNIQAYARSFLARKKLAQRRMQEKAIVCIQRNIDKYMLVKTWPWWKLYTRVVPLLHLQRTEQEMHDQAGEIEALRAKIASLEKTLAEQKLVTDRLDARLADAQGELSEERLISNQATEALERENTERVRVEKEYTELKSKFGHLERQAQKVELEALEYRTLKNAMVSDDEDEGGEGEGDGATGGGNNLVQLKQQLKVQKKQLTQQKKEDQQKTSALKTELETKIHKLESEKVETEESLAKNKRRAQKAQEELQDVQIHLNTLTARNSELERKQRKFDSELKGYKDTADSERLQKEKLMREREEAMAKVYSLHQALKKAEGSSEDGWKKVEELERDLAQLNDAAEGKVSESHVVHIQRQLQEVTSKVTDQEEELDDLAGQLQQANAKNTRLEMAAEKTRMDHGKELESKESELEDLRAQNQRRLKSMEQQLEDECEEKSNLMRSVRELESKLRQANDLEPIRDESGEIELRKDLKKTKALLKDAQLMLQHYKTSAPNRGMIKQLKNQLEDAEFSRISSYKVKQSLEADMSELRTQLESAIAGKTAAEERCLQIMKEKNNIMGQVEDQEEELQQLLKKYKAQVQQSSVDHITMNDQIQTIADLEKRNEDLKEKVGELESRTQWDSTHTVDKHKLILADQKIRDLEAKLDLELSLKTRLESSGDKVKEKLEALQGEIVNLKAARDREQEMNRRLQKQLSNAQESAADAQKKEGEAAQKNHDLEAAMERSEIENEATLGDLKLALRRIDDLQAVLQDDIQLDMFSDGEDDDDDVDDDDDDDDVDITINHHNSSRNPLSRMNVTNESQWGGSNVTSPLPHSLSTSSGRHRNGSGSSGGWSGAAGGTKQSVQPTNKHADQSVV